MCGGEGGGGEVLPPCILVVNGRITMKFCIEVENRNFIQIFEKFENFNCRGILMLLSF